MIHADLALARKLEGLICAEWRRLADTSATLWPDKKATCLEVAGGVALWLGDASLVNVATGLALDGPITEADLRRVEDFYARRGAVPIMSTCAFADPSLFALLARRRWQVTEFENVLALELSGSTGRPTGGSTEPAKGSAQASETSDVFLQYPLPRGAEVRVCTEAERELWGQVAPRGFNEECEPGPGHMEFGALMAARENAILVLGWVDGQPAGTGALVIDDDVAWLSADSTLPQYRRRGVQLAVQRYRLQLARDAGCTLAVTESLPGSGSQRNMERLGFRLVYTHLEFAKV